MIWRLVSFAMGGIGAVLVVGTVTGARYAAFGGRTGVFVLGIVLGLVTAGVSSGVRRAPITLGCAGFGAVTVVVGTIVATVVASVLPDVALSLAGATLLGIFAALTGSVAYAVFDEGGPETVPPVAIPNEAPAVGADEVQTT